MEGEFEMLELVNFNECNHLMKQGDEAFALKNYEAAKYNYEMVCGKQGNNWIAHLKSEICKIYIAVKAGNYEEALNKWSDIVATVKTMFDEQYYYDAEDRYRYQGIFINSILESLKVIIPYLPVDKEHPDQWDTEWLEKIYTVFNELVGIVNHDFYVKYPSTGDFAGLIKGILEAGDDFKDFIQKVSEVDSSVTEKATGLHKQMRLLRYQISTWHGDRKKYIDFYGDESNKNPVVSYYLQSQDDAEKAEYEEMLDNLEILRIKRRGIVRSQNLLQPQINALDETINLKNAQIDEADEKIEARKGRFLGALTGRKEIKELEAEISDIEEELDSLNSQKTSLNEQKDDLEKQLFSIQNEEKELSDRLIEYEKKVLDQH